MRYENPRLISEQVALYSPPWWSRVPLVGHIVPHGRDREWDRCWRGYELPVTDTSPPEASYKSTLIVPITLWNNDLDQAFIEAIRNKFGIPTFERFIFAFLCLDHRERDYFDEKRDSDMAYVFADIMSLYFFRKWTLTALSSVYQYIQRHLPAEEDRDGRQKVQQRAKFER